MSTRKISIGGALITSLLLAAGAASAADRSATSRDITVKFSNAQLTNEADAEQVYRKLRLAARRVCDDIAGGNRTLVERMHVRQCVDAALADAVRKIDQPRLTALHRSKAGKSDQVG